MAAWPIILWCVIENQQPLDFQDNQFCLKPKPTMFQIPTIVLISSSDVVNYNNNHIRAMVRTSLVVRLFWLFKKIAIKGTSAWVFRKNQNWRTTSSSYFSNIKELAVFCERIGSLNFDFLNLKKMRIQEIKKIKFQNSACQVSEYILKLIIDGYP